MTKKNRLKDTLIEVRDIVFANKKITEEELEKFSEKSVLNYEYLVEFYELIKLWHFQRKKIEKTTYWTKAEETILLMFVEIQSELEQTSISNSCKELAELFLRPKGGVYFKFNTLTKHNETKDNNQLVLEDISDGDMGLLSDTDSNIVKTEENALEGMKKDIISIQPHDVENSIVKQTSNNLDLIDVMAQLVSNVETVGLNIDSFFMGLLDMSRKAVENSNKEQITELEEKIEFLYIQLNKEKKTIDELQRNAKTTHGLVEEMIDELSFFESLTGSQKLQQLNEFTNRLKKLLKNM